jgi:hypothetical protein
MADSTLVAVRPASKPNASIVVDLTLPDGTQARCIWAWLSQYRRAKLVTVFIPQATP